MKMKKLFSALFLSMTLLSLGSINASTRKRKMKKRLAKKMRDVHVQYTQPLRATDPVSTRHIRRTGGYRGAIRFGGLPGAVNGNMNERQAARYRLGGLPGAVNGNMNERQAAR